VLVVRPGLVTTKMTAGRKPAPMSVAPEDVADATVKALAGRAHTGLGAGSAALRVSRHPASASPALSEACAVNIHPLLLDGLVAAAVAVVLLVVTPGVAIAGPLATVILSFCAITLAADRRRLRHRPQVRRRPR
jgi:hypothetical protein